MNPDQTGEPANDAPQLQLTALIFSAKTVAAQTKRGALNLKSRIKRHERQNQPYPHILAESRCPLWNRAEPDTVDLQQIRVQNLRCAVHALNGVHIAAGQIFSFWKEVGRPTRAKGFARGYEVRENMLIPEVGSGLHQLAGALHHVALQAGLHVLESRPNLYAAPGEPPVTRHDTAVAWNYNDLRLRSNFAWQIEALLTGDELIVRLRDSRPPRATALRENSTPERSNTEIEAVKSELGAATPAYCPPGRTFYVLDEYWPEFQAFIEAEHIRNAGLAIPLDGEVLNRTLYRWKTKHYSQVVTATITTLQRSRKTRHIRGPRPGSPSGRPRYPRGNRHCPGPAVTARRHAPRYRPTPATLVVEERLSGR